MKILSLDVSSSCTGYARFEVIDKKITLEEVGSIKAKGSSLYERIKFIQDNFEKIGLFDWPELVVFEDYAFKGNRVTQLAEVNSVFKWKYFQEGIPFDTIAPASVKKLVTGNGRADKKQVQESVRSLPLFSGVTFNNADESDAAAVGYGYIIKRFGDAR